MRGVTCGRGGALTVEDEGGDRAQLQGEQRLRSAVHDERQHRSGQHPHPLVAHPQHRHLGPARRPQCRLRAHAGGLHAREHALRAVPGVAAACVPRRAHRARRGQRGQRRGQVRRWSAGSERSAWRRRRVDRGVRGRSIGSVGSVESVKRSGVRLSRRPSGARRHGEEVRWWCGRHLDGILGRDVSLPTAQLMKRLRRMKRLRGSRCEHFELAARCDWRLLPASGSFDLHLDAALAHGPGRRARAAGQVLSFSGAARWRASLLPTTISVSTRTSAGHPAHAPPAARTSGTPLRQLRQRQALRRLLHSAPSKSLLQ
jgi:hypothetical protein